MNKIQTVCTVAASAAVALILTLAVIFGVKDIPVPKLKEGTVGDGSIYTYSIYDLKDVNRMCYAYYTPDEFIIPGNIDYVTGELVDITRQTDIAARGTYQFLIENLDPMDENFDEKSRALAPYLQDDNNWHFTVYIPPCFSACCIYVRSVLTERAGDIEGYDYIRYSDKQGFSEEHTTKTEPFLLDVGFYTRRQAIGDSLSQRAVVITIHYEAEQGKYAGLSETPLIGSGEKLNGILVADRAALFIITIIGMHIFMILAFICVLKKSLFAIPQTAMALGISGFLLFKLMTHYASGAPYLLRAMLPVCLALLVIAAALSVVYTIKSHKTGSLLAIPPVVAFFVTFLCTDFVTPVMNSPLIWLSVLILGIVAFSEFKFFIEQEKRNVFLTNNLQSEVMRQTADLKNIVNERDKLLRFVSHDMKKPISGAKRFIAEIKKDEQNPEHLKALNVIEQKLDIVQEQFAELQKFAKINFTAEESEISDIADIFGRNLPIIEPDCEANGIILNYHLPHISVYAKRDTLASVLNNLIFNAIEHADCKNIYVTASKARDKCKICVRDDGKGLDGENAAFLPYQGENGGENLGLGLYICRQHMLSMGGDLTYGRENGKTSFTLTLPLS